MIYVHIPFCDSKCYYCNFSSGKYDQKTQQEYFKKLCQEIQKNSNKNIKITSIYIGGGTPSSVDEKYIKQILKEIKNNFNLQKNAEITIEANPCSITKNKLNYYQKIGINRISIGVQSLNNKCLNLIGRKHTKHKAIRAIKLCKKSGFKNINCDILIGIPKQNYFILKKTIKKLIKLKINHISCYMLINEKNTPLTKKIESNQLKIVPEDKCVNYYNKLTKYLQKHGFDRYEISNFCLCGYQCKHNLGYWNLTNYYGFGLSAHSFVDGYRYNNMSNMQGYLNSNFEYQKESLSKNEQIEELIMLSLRTANGVSIKNLQDLGFDILKDKQTEISLLQKNKFIDIQNGHIKVTPQSFGVTNQIILKLLP